MVKTGTGSTQCITTVGGGQQLNTGLANFNSACASSDDGTRQQTFLAGFINDFNSQKASLNSNYTNLKLTANALYDYSSGNDSTTVSNTKTELQKQKLALEKELKAYQEKSQVEDREFLDNLMHNGPPQDESFPTLQDVGLGIFLIGWFLVGLLLIYVQKMNVGWKGAFMVLLFYAVASILVYGILQYLA